MFLENLKSGKLNFYLLVLVIILLYYICFNDNIEKFRSRSRSRSFGGFTRRRQTPFTSPYSFTLVTPSITKKSAFIFDKSSNLSIESKIINSGRYYDYVSVLNSKFYSSDVGIDLCLRIEESDDIKFVNKRIVYEKCKTIDKPKTIINLSNELLPNRYIMKPYTHYKIIIYVKNNIVDDRKLRLKWNDLIIKVTK
jgi:hypothetical protein